MFDVIYLFVINAGLADPTIKERLAAWAGLPCR
jgi:hypothetical protein